MFRSIADRMTRNASRIPGVDNTINSICRRWLLTLIVASAFGMTARAQSYYYVDCSGTNPNDYATIGAALAVAGPNSYLIVTSTCNENVNITNAWNLNVGAPYGSTANINGNVSVVASNSVFLYGLNVTNSKGDAFDINSSHNVTLWTCTGNGNGGGGLSAQTMSDVTVDGPGSFDDNRGPGIGVGGNSFLNVLTWGGQVDISGNRGGGVSTGDGGLFQTLGNTTITGNINTSQSVRPNGFGIQAVSNSKIQVSDCFGPTVISGNQSGGIDVRESAQVALWGCGHPGDIIVKDNGPVGISVGIGSELALYTEVAISGHAGPGVELYSQGQLYMYGANVISQNGNAADPRSAGVVVDGNSEAYLRGGVISSNIGPGILALVNSSVDSVGATFSGNTGGIATCDSSAYMVSDLLSAKGDRPERIGCRTPHNLGNRRGVAAVPAIPDLTTQKNQAAKYKAFASVKH
jgi:hypothetical protein